jgi:3-oxocholest-4-en-26-oyl-CoA dehydrogenase alpha subunit
VVERQLEDTIEWAATTKLADGTRVIDQEWVQINLARVHAKLDFLKLMNWRVVSHDKPNPADSSGTKVFGTEFFTEAYRLLLEVVGLGGALQRGSPGAVLQGRLERGYQGTLILTFGGGTNEVQRDLIALFGLGMPRTPRS